MWKAAKNSPAQVEAWAGIVEETRGGGRTREAKTEAEEEMESSSELELMDSSFRGVRPLKLMVKIGQRRRRCAGRKL